MINEKDIIDYKAMGWDQPTPTHDPVHKPKHYMLLPGVEVRDVIQALVNKMSGTVHPMFAADYVQMMQYLMRFMEKNGQEDLKKALWYLNKLIEAGYK